MATPSKQDLQQADAVSQFVSDLFTAVRLEDVEMSADTMREILRFAQEYNEDKFGVE